MINKHKFLEGARRYLLEETFSGMSAMSDDARKARSRGMIVRYTRIYQDKDDGHAVTEWNVPSQNTPGKSYTCDVGLIVKGGLFNLAKKKWNATEFSIAFSQADVRVYCNCKDFNYSGAKFNTGPNSDGKLRGNNTYAKSSGYKGEEDIATKAPNIRDPYREHILCKHLNAVFNRFKNNAFDIMRDAKKFNATGITVSDDVTSAVKKGKPLLRKDAKQDELRKGLTEAFTSEVIQLHKDKKLDDVESKDVIDTVVSTNVPDDTIIPPVDNSMVDDVITTDVTDRKVDPTQIVTSDTPETKPENDLVSDVTDTNPDEILEKDKPKDKSVIPSAQDILKG